MFLRPPSHPVDTSINCVARNDNGYAGQFRESQALRQLRHVNNK